MYKKIKNAAISKEWTFLSMGCGSYETSQRVCCLFYFKFCILQVRFQNNLVKIIYIDTVQYKNPYLWSGAWKRFGITPNVPRPCVVIILQICWHMVKCLFHLYIFTIIDPVIVSPCGSHISIYLKVSEPKESRYSKHGILLYKSQRKAF